MKEILKKLITKENSWLLILIGALLLLLLMPMGKNNKTSERIRDTDAEKTEKNLVQNKTQKSEQDLLEENYISTQEEKLTEILSRMEGLKKVQVMITLKASAEQVTREETPYIVKTYGPEIEGVLVVAQGVEDGAVKKTVSDAIQALYPIEAHKIKIVPMQRK